MRRVLLFVGIVAGLLVAAGLVNWRVDPYGEFYDGGPLRAAARSSPPCLVSDELIGGQSYLRFKEDLFGVRPTRTIVVGSSRVLRIESRPGERTFSNVGLPSTSPDSILALFRALRPRGPLTAYVGVELFWFNPSWTPISFGQSLGAKVRYLLGRSNLVQSLKIVRDSPSAAIRGWRRERVGGRCVLGRGTPGIAWNVDGSRVYSFELDPRLYRPPAGRYTTDISKLRYGLYARWHGFADDRLRVLDRALALAQRHGWRVVGFAPPDSTRYVRLLERSPETAGPWREFYRRIPALFRARGFRWLDLHDVREVPCGQHEFVDDGFHVNASCAARVRSRLDAAARGR